MSSTATSVSTVRDLLNSNKTGVANDALGKAPLGDILSILLDTRNASTSIAAVTATGAVTPTATGAVVPTATGAVTPTATGALTPTATGALTQTATGVTAATAVNPASAAYASPDQTILAALGNANRTAINACVTDLIAVKTKLDAAVVDISAADTKASAAVVDVSALATKLAAATVDISALATKVSAADVDISALATKLNAAVVDISALRSEMAAINTAGTVGGANDPGLSVTSNTATLSAQPTANGLITVNATAGTHTGVKKLIRDPSHVLATGEVFWDGSLTLKFAAIDAVSACDCIYATASLSQKVSCLMRTQTE